MRARSTSDIRQGSTSPATEDVLTTEGGPRSTKNWILGCKAYIYIYIYSNQGVQIGVYIMVGVRDQSFYSAFRIPSNVQAISSHGFMDPAVRNVHQPAPPKSDANQWPSK